MSITSFCSTSSNATAAANNTISNSNFTSGTRTGATNTPSTATASGTTPTSVIASQQFPGPYRDEHVLLGPQLLAYLSKYPHVRQAFYKTRPSFHRAIFLTRRAVAIWLPEEPREVASKARVRWVWGICGQSQISLYKRIAATSRRSMGVVSYYWRLVGVGLIGIYVRAEERESKGFARSHTTYRLCIQFLL